MKKRDKKILIALWTLWAGMYGGQKNKTVRRYGIPLIALTAGGFSRRAWPMIFLIPLLMIGYGESSWLMSLLGDDWLVRVVYGVLLSLPFAFYGLKRWLAAVIALVLAFQVQAGSLGQIGGHDILIEDMVRYGVLGVLITFNVFF